MRGGWHTRWGALAHHRWVLTLGLCSLACGSLWGMAGAKGDVTGRGAVAFVREVGDGSRTHNEVWLLDLHTGRSRRISAPDEQVQSGCSYSARSGLLAWWSVVIRATGLRQYALRTWRARTGDLNTVYGDMWAPHGEPPAFTPDGERLLFGRSRGDLLEGTVRDQGIWQVRTDGSGLRRVTAGFGTKGPSDAPKVSPDGTLIAFGGRFWEEGCALYLTDWQGRQKRLPLVLSNFDWQPRHHRLVMAQLGLADQPWDTRLVGYDIRTSKTTTITPYRRNEADYAPSFSPDGTKLAYISSRWASAGADHLKVRDLRTGETIVAAQVHVAGRGPWFSWSGDGQLLFYQALPPGQSKSESEIWVVRADGGGSHRLTQEGSSPVYVGGSGGAGRPS